MKALKDLRQRIKEVYDAGNTMDAHKRNMLFMWIDRATKKELDKLAGEMALNEVGMVGK